MRLTKSLALLPLLAACTDAGPVAENVPEPMTKEEVRALTSGAADHAFDYCEYFGWYGDDICDEFCLSPDPDCAPVEEECFRTGCSGDICADQSIITTCEFRPESICLDNATCERQADGACGFSLTAEEEQCLEEVQQGEDLWVTIRPTQCGTNPWQRDPAPTDGFEHLPGELAAIAAYYQSQGIQLKEVGLVEPAHPIAVCAACSCPRGDQLVVRVSAFDAQRLKAEGFQVLEGAVALSPTQCGTNPWEMNPAPIGPFEFLPGELGAIAAFYANAGADVGNLGLVEHVEPIAVCLACSCPRGDLLIALPTAEDKDELLGLGFSPL